MSANVVESIKSMAGGKAIRHTLDCITDAESCATCFSALGRAGGRYACLEECPHAWRTRQTVKVKEVMGYEILGQRVYLGLATTYTREPSEMAFQLGLTWAAEMQALLDRGWLDTHPVVEVQGRWEGITKGLAMLQRGEVRGHKLIVQIATLSS